MSTEFLDGRVTVHAGDNLPVLKSLADCSIDSVVTDPPYALVSIVKRFGKTGAAAAKHGTDGLYARASAGFMGKAWDTGERAFAVDFWAEVYRVLKPGGHVVAFSGTRTYHRMAVAIEDAGFEIRDQIGWLYATGFPKSHDVSKGIEKRRVEDIGPTRAICRIIRAAMDERGLKSKDLTPHFSGCHPRLIDHWAARDTDSQPSLPTIEQWIVLKDHLGLPSDLDAEVERLNLRKGEFGSSFQERPITGEHEDWADRVNYALRSRDGLRRDVATTDEGRAWEGWGTALKPAWEPICVARKPLIGSVAQNVVAHGTGALNIDGCRVEGVKDVPSSPRRAAQGSAYGDLGKDPGTGSGWDRNVGRWPANIIHDGSDEVLAAFPHSDGQNGAITGQEPSANGFSGVVYGYGGIARRSIMEPRGDSGSAARFFFSAKADGDDRLGSKHPTVKPVALMQWLIRLVTPPGGTVLDPFAGTGTTGEAAWREGMRAVLVEREPEYLEDIARRMRLADRPDERAAVAKAKGIVDSAESLPLFAGAAP